MNKTLYILSFIFLFSIISVNALPINNRIVHLSFDSQTISTLIDDSGYNNSFVAVNNSPILHSYTNGIGFGGSALNFSSCPKPSYLSYAQCSYNKTSPIAIMGSDNSFAWNYWIKIYGDGGNNAGHQIIDVISDGGFSYARENVEVNSDWSHSAGDYHNIYGISGSATGILEYSYYHIEPSPFKFDGVNSSWVMVTVSYDGTNIKVYRNGVLNVTNTLGGFTGHRFAIVNPRNAILDELSIFNTSLNQSDINELYAVGNVSDKTYNPISIIPALSNVNQKIVSNNVYLFPIIEDSTIITGLYNVLTESNNSYASIICDYTETPIFEDYGNYDFLTSNGWVGGELYNVTSVFNANLGRSISLHAYDNTTYGSISKSFTPTNNDSIVSYIVKPQSLNFGDNSGDLLVDIQSSIGQSIVPLLFRFDDNTNTLCVDGFIQAQTTLLCINNYNNLASDYVKVKINIEVSSSIYDLVVEYGQKYYTTKLDTYVYGADNIGRIFVNPTFASSSTDSYIDNINITVTPPRPDLTFRDTIFINATSGSFGFVEGATTTYGNSNFGLISKEIPYVYSLPTESHTYTNLFTTQCDYSVVKCYTTRFYGQENSQGIYNNYEDFKLCSSLNTAISSPTATDSTAQTSSFLFGNGLNTAYKMLIVFITMLVIMGASAVIGFQTDTSKASIVVGVTLCLFGLIFFTVFGWIPSWVLVMLIIFALATMIIIGKQNNVASG